MATATKTTAKGQASKAAEAPAPVRSFTVKPSDTGVKRQSKVGDNPLADAFRQSLDGPLFVPADSPEAVKDIKNLLRLAQSHHNAANADNQLGLKVSEDWNADKTEYGVHFQATNKKVVRKYTVAEIKKWAAENGHTVPTTGRLPKPVREAFKAAHGYTGKADSDS